jgi:hypothetical protein
MLEFRLKAEGLQLTMKEPTWSYTYYKANNIIYYSEPKGLYLSL